MCDDERFQQDPVLGERDIERDDEGADTRFRLTALGEAVVGERRARRFRGFGPCSIATLPTAG